MNIEDCGFGKFHVFLCIIMLILNIVMGPIIFLPPFTTMERTYNCSENVTLLNTSSNLESICNFCPRDKIVFDQSTFTSTMQSQYGLVCENEKLVGLFITSHSIGAMSGLILNGIIGDKYPRLSIIRYGLIMLIIGLIVCIASPYFLFSIFGRYFVGLFDLVIYSTQITYLNEITPRHYREIVTNIVFLGGTISQVTLALIGYLVRNHVTLQWVIISGCSIALVLMIWLPESPMWLIDKKRFEDAKVSLRRIYVLNNPNESTHLHMFTVDYVTNDMLIREKEDISICQKIVAFKAFWLKVSFSDVWNEYYGILRSCVVLSIIFSISAVVFYSLIFDLDKTHGNVFGNMLWLSGVNFTTDIIFPLLLKFVGRRAFIFTFGFISGAISIILGVMITYGYRLVEKGLTFVLNSASSMIYSGVLIYIGELLPTNIRNSGTSFVYSTSQISVAFSPFIIPDAYRNISYCCLGSLLLLTSCLAVFLPETTGKKLPESAKESVVLNSVKNSVLPSSWRKYLAGCTLQVTQVHNNKQMNDLTTEIG